VFMWRFSSVAAEEIEDCFGEFVGVMASSGDGVGHLSCTSLVFREGTSTPSRNGRDKKGLRTPQAVKQEITGNSRILAEPGWDSVTTPLWVCNTAKKYVKLHHIDKLFPEAVWVYNHRASGVKPKESTSKHFAHCALGVWSVLYPNKPFGLDNKNIISYSMAAMVYVEIQLTRKVDWRTLLTRNKEDRTGYAKADIPDNFTFFSQKVGVRPGLMHLEPIETLRLLQEQYRTKILWEKQFALQKADPGLRTKRVPAHQRSWTVSQHRIEYFPTMFQILL
jgi:hypothetical protein